MSGDGYSTMAIIGIVMLLAGVAVFFTAVNQVRETVVEETPPETKDDLIA